MSIVRWTFARSYSVSMFGNGPTTVQKNLDVHKNLVRKFGSPPPTPRKRAQNEEKLYKSVENPQVTLFLGGGGCNAILWKRRFASKFLPSFERPLLPHSLGLAMAIVRSVEGQRRLPSEIVN